MSKALLGVSLLLAAAVVVATATSLGVDSTEERALRSQAHVSSTLSTGVTAVKHTCE